LPILVGVLLALGIAAGSFYVNRPVVAVWPPPGEIATTAYKNLVIPLSEAPSADNSAVQARALNTPADVTVQGQASKQLSPSGTARGIVQIINTLSNPIDLPADTQFIAANAAGQQVSFLIDGPQTVPAAIYSQSQFGSSVQYGNIEVAISARSPGSASNVGEGTVAQLLIPGQPPIASSEQVRLLNGPIEGGSEAEIFVVGQQDVSKMLGPALGQLYEQGAAALRAQPVPVGFAFDATTVYPSPDVLGDPANYTVVGLEPPVGQPVADQNNPVFTLQLRANFNALATPPDKLLDAQLGSVVPTALEQQKNGNLCAAGEDVGFDAVNYRWDGRQLAADGAYTCTPRGALSDAALAQVRSAVVGQSAAGARASLDQLVQEGQIGGYRLPPDVGEFSGIGFMIQIERESGSPPAAPTASPGRAAPTAGATP
ncbi:MAG: hypothetical protein H7Z42_21215, partial [Roseiflexaceae bacterium]|nr:hypothetical protein [Roseiflexaceae bacterium]